MLYKSNLSFFISFFESESIARCNIVSGQVVRTLTYGTLILLKATPPAAALPSNQKL